jgi:hypothetical protein
MTTGRRDAAWRGDMKAMDIEHTRASHGVAAISRRALVAAGAGWVLGAAGLLLPATGDEATARGALGGAKGGRHGKDQRGRNKHRGKDNNEPGDDKQTHDDGLFGEDAVSVVFVNSGSVDLEVYYNNSTKIDGGEQREDRIPAHTSRSYTGTTSATIVNITSPECDGCFIYSVEFRNPSIGRPWVTAVDQHNTFFANETGLSEGDSVDDRRRLLVTRNSDSGDSKWFTLEVGP